MTTASRHTLVGKSALAVTAMLATIGAQAEDFQYEVGGDYLAQSLTVSGTTITFPNFPDTTVTETQPFEIRSDADRFSLAGTWFFDPVSTEQGPLSRAAFLDRASSLSLGIANDDVDNGSERESLNLASRYVFKDSDWFVGGSYLFSRSESGLSIPESIINRVYSFDVGRYFGDSTAASFGIARNEVDPGLDFDDINTTFLLLSLSHIGELGSKWQFGVDATLTMPEDNLDDGLLEARFSFYPTREIAFGFDFSAAIKDTGDRPRRYGVFGSWFVTESLELSANYGWVELDSSGFTEVEEKSWGIGARYRF